MVGKEEMIETKKGWEAVKPALENELNELKAKQLKIKQEKESNSKRRKTLRKTILYAVACVAVAGASTVFAAVSGIWGIAALTCAMTGVCVGFCTKYTRDLIKLSGEADRLTQQSITNRKNIKATEAKLSMTIDKIESLGKLLERPGAKQHGKKNNNVELPKPGGDEKTDGGDGPSDCEGEMER